ncbi:MAG TPA: hypothetical protein VMH04_05555 [Candidatus Solibacter sp.]|nr:hypothetical protein [Candidatus Solibacter sp.]
MRALALLLLSFLYSLVGFAENSSGVVRSVGISPDGKVVAVAFHSGRHSFIYEIDVTSGNATRLTNQTSGVESSPSFSPDGRRIVFTYWPEGSSNSETVLANTDGSGIRHWSPSNTNDFSPVLSSDGRTIVFGRSGFYGSYSPIAQPHFHAWRFYASDLDGTNVRQLTDENFYSASPLSVSPDGKRLVVVTEGLETPQQIAIYALDHSGKPVLTLRPSIPNGADSKNPILDFPNYMPDGKSILFMAASNGKRPWSGFDYDVYRVNLETGTLERLTRGNGFATDLRVSADGKTAVFLKWRCDWQGTPKRSSLYLLDVPTRKLTQLKVAGLN